MSMIKNTKNDSKKRHGHNFKTNHAHARQSSGQNKRQSMHDDSTGSQVRQERISTAQIVSNSTNNSSSTGSSASNKSSCSSSAQKPLYPNSTSSSTNLLCKHAADTSTSTIAKSNISHAGSANVGLQDQAGKQYADKDDPTVPTNAVMSQLHSHSLQIDSASMTQPVIVVNKPKCADSANTSIIHDIKSIERNISEKLPMEATSGSLCQSAATVTSMVTESHLLKEEASTFSTRMHIKPCTQIEEVANCTSTAYISGPLMEISNLQTGPPQVSNLFHL